MDNPPEARSCSSGRDARAPRNPVRAHAAAMGLPTMDAPVIEAGHVTVTRCVRCGAADGGTLARCRQCGSVELERVGVPGRGRLVSWTVVRRPSGPFAHRDAFAVALVDLEAGPRVTGNLEGWERDPPLGAAVSVVGDIDGIPLFAQECP